MYKVVFGHKKAMGELSRLADFPIIGSLNALAKTIQKYDIENPLGERSLLLSQHRELIAGFNLNKTHPLDSIFRSSIGYTVNRENLSAQITLPRINTEVHLVNYRNLPLFRLIFVLSTISDLIAKGDSKEYRETNMWMTGCTQTYFGEWAPTESVIEEQIFDLKIAWNKDHQIDENTSLMLTAGIEFGTLGNDGKPKEVKYAGCAKVLAVV